jgi:hypothetical protein
MAIQLGAGYRRRRGRGHRQRGRTLHAGGAAIRYSKLVLALG